MGVSDGLKPQKVFAFFEEITRIPHGSGNVEKISDHLVEFAKRRGLRFIQDEQKNVILFKEASKGYEGEPTVILQGHMDMVAVKRPELDMDMRTEGLKVAVEGDYVYAEGTSLGGDDGIAVAYAMALLDSDDIAHPALEVVITVDEEVGMDGAREIDLSMLKGHRLLNLDSEEEGIFLTSCAGGARVNCAMECRAEEASGRLFALTVGGLLGGHSGEMIDRERGNSNLLFGRLLRALSVKLPVRLICAAGGLADNAIPRETTAKLLIPDSGEAVEQAERVIEAFAREVTEELSTKDPGFWVGTQDLGPAKETAFGVADTQKIAMFLVALPNGVQAMSADIPGLVETSLNLGILSIEKGRFSAEISVRSSIGSAKMALIDRLRAITDLAGGAIAVSGDYPGWKYRADSPLREKMIRVYEEMYQKSPEVKAIHAGLECGLLGSKIEDLDCVSIGPDMKDIHTTEEKLSISSVARVWEFIVRLLATKDAEIP